MKWILDSAVHVGFGLGLLGLSVSLVSNSSVFCVSFLSCFSCVVSFISCVSVDFFVSSMLVQFLLSLSRLCYRIPHDLDFHHLLSYSL